MVTVKLIFTQFFLTTNFAKIFILSFVVMYGVSVKFKLILEKVKISNIRCWSTLPLGHPRQTLLPKLLFLGTLYILLCCRNFCRQK